jgi:hypothetical protein
MFLMVDRNSTPEQISDEIKRRLDERIDGTRTWEDRIVSHVPVFVLEKILAGESGKSRESGLYRFPAIISNMGRFKPGDYSAPCFTAESVFLIPIANELIPYFLAFVGRPEGFDMMLVLPGAYGSEGRIDAIMDRLAAALVE